MTQRKRLIEMVCEITTAYVGNNAIAPGDVPAFIRELYEAYSGLGQASTAPPAPTAPPAVPIKKSVTPELIYCLEDGLGFKSLKRHLRTHFGLSPEEYRMKWGLPADYPMVAPNYAAARSELAKQMGLGQKRQLVRKSRKS